MWKLTFILEMIVIITITLGSDTQGLPETCFNDCKYSSNQSHILQQECNCTNTSEEVLTSESIWDESENSGIENAAPLGLNAIESTLPTNINNAQNKTNISEITALDDESNNTFQNYTSDESYNVSESGNLIEFPLYLDVDLRSINDQNSSNLKEELKDLFDKVRVLEKDVDECINLHIYIFSKYNNTINRTHTNMGHHVEFDNLSSADVLTEIENKCDEPTTIIHESVYEIRQKKQYNFTQNNHITDKDNISMYEQKKYGRNRDDISTTLTNSRLYRLTPDFENNLFESSTAPPENKMLEQRVIVNQTLYVSIQSNQKGEKYLNTTTFKTIILPDGSKKTMKRSGYLEKDIHITKILTKELSNNTVTSVITGFETIPNFDFVNQDEISLSKIDENSVSYNEDRVPSSDVSNLVNSNRNQSNLVQDIKGNLYFSIGNDQIPARFIQNSEGEMHLAVDGFSLCDQMVRVQNQQNKLVFMKLLCNCIQFHNCSHSLS